MRGHDTSITVADSLTVITVKQLKTQLGVHVSVTKMTKSVTYDVKRSFQHLANILEISER